jgi:putative endopeptidase
MKSAKKTVLRLTWLSDSSRKIANFKLDRMKLQIAFPDVWVEEIKENMDPNNFIKNILLLNKTDMMFNLKKLFLPIDERIWDNACYDVNAYYYTELNLLNIPLGFLKAPFFALEQSFVQNLAGVGNIMAHEMAHGFDEEGRKFDEKGNYKPWWVSTDIELYNRKTRQLVNFFDKEYYFGLRVSGELTLGENLADLGAMAICLAVLKERHSKMDSNARLKELREFFTWYAKSWVYKETPEKRTQAIKKDVHSPPQIRVNAIVRQFSEFFEAFSIGPGDAGYLAENERIDIWG